MKCLICHMRDRASNNLEALPCLGKSDSEVIWDCSWIPPGPMLTHVLRLIHTTSNGKCLKKGKQVSIPRADTIIPTLKKLICALHWQTIRETE